jgi:hypothetical protein
MSCDHHSLLLCDVAARKLHSNGPSVDKENMSYDIYSTAADITALAPNGHAENTATSTVT